MIDDGIGTTGKRDVSIMRVLIKQRHLRLCPIYISASTIYSVIIVHTVKETSRDLLISDISVFIAAITTDRSVVVPTIG